MEVNKTNFYENISDILKKLDECEFIAIDAEMTGLPDTYDYQSRNESLDLRYDRLKKESKCFMIIQYGICPVKFDRVNNKYVAYPFNFYIYPRQYHNISSDSHFICSGTSLEFLSDHGFDFNKWIKEGIPYMREREETVALENIDKEINFIRSKMRSTEGDEINIISSVPNDIQQHMDIAIDKISEFLVNKDFETFDIQATDERFRKYLLISINIKFYKIVSAEIYEENDFKYIRIKRLISEQRIRELQEKKKYLAGFSSIIRKIFTLKKPIVGHNLLLDLLMTCRQFYRGLPRSLPNLKTFLNELLPTVFDTKMIALSTDSLYRGSTILGDLYSGLINFEFCKKKQIQIDENFTRYNNNNFFHEAGYDAYVTACCFVWLSYSFDSSNENGINYKSSILNEFKNKLYLSNISEGKVLDISPTRIRSNEFRVAVCYYSNPQKKQTKHDQLIGYTFIWKSDVMGFIVAPYKISKHEIQRIKAIVKCEHIYKLNDWKTIKKEILPVKDDPILSINKYIQDSASR